MAKRTVEFEDTTGPFKVKLKGNTDGEVTLLVHDTRTVSKPSRLYMDLESSTEVGNLANMLLSMAEDLETEMNR